MTDEQRQRVREVLTETYGPGGFVSQDMTNDVVNLIERGNLEGPLARRDRKELIMLRCWDWMPGGSRAEMVSRKIEAILEYGVG